MFERVRFAVDDVRVSDAPWHEGEDHAVEVAVQLTLPRSTVLLVCDDGTCEGTYTYMTADEAEKLGNTLLAAAQALREIKI